MRKKLKDSSGLTLVEMLCATVILVLLCLMLNSGLGMAIKTYQGITAESETQLLLSSLSDALADKLRYCVVYTDEATGECSGTSIGEITVNNGRIFVTGSVSGEQKPLLPDGAYGNSDGFYKGNYQVTIGSSAPGGADSAALKDIYQKDTNSFAVKLTVKDVNLNITKTRELTVRCLNPPKEAAETPPEGETP